MRCKVLQQNMPRRNHRYRYQQDYYHHQDYYYQPCWIDWIIVSLMLGVIAIFIIGYFIFNSDRKAELANAEATKNYEKIISIAVKSCDFEVVKFLMERNLVNIHRGSGKRLLGYATEKECLEVVQFLVGGKVNINSTSVIEIDKRTVLHYAAEQGNLEIVKFLLQNGANPNAKEFREKKPRDLAVIMLRHNKNNKPYREIIDLLTEAEKNYKLEK
ncbi:ankyrin repeat domain-containing protein [Wolbachia endosymbiont of Tribolium confusum]|uniref:ankyrin repeat domain-containing protein n=1 Tax=Wolbachia endosymbiont of Tribolium confusum TaxID=214474 RepID=UPI001CF58852|nr:ankyrin repeat domain-containing protein [Wolbachia endosymbiont of Tribolium confusum]MCA7010482.1 ankyrin repeat domain-containing protein [Wolbachia endosymbiont of Tribolium confusum]